MDLVFWIPWTIGLVVFILWVKNPIIEFKTMWDQQHAKNDEPPDQTSE